MHYVFHAAPVQRHRKFSAVLGTTSARSSITMRPTGALSAVMSKKTLGLAMVAELDEKSSGEGQRRSWQC